MKQYFPRRFDPYMGYRFRRPYAPPPYGYRYVTIAESLNLAEIVLWKLLLDPTLKMRLNLHSSHVL